MNNPPPIFVLISSIMFAPLAFAETIDPLWLKTIAIVNANKNWAPKIRVLQMNGNLGGQAERYVFTQQLSGWTKANPTYIIVSVLPVPTDTKKISESVNMKGLMDGVDDEIYQPNAAINRSDGISLNGKICSLFELEQGTIQKTKIKLWVDSETGRIFQRKLSMNAPMIQGDVMTIYNPEELDKNRPTSSNIQLNITIPFKSGKIDIKEFYSNWVERPQ